MNASVGLTLEREKKLLHALFFIFGFGIMAWVPRFPEVKANLGLSNGAFGSILTTGAIGAFTGLLTVGHIVHKVGVRNVMIAATALLYSSFVAIVHVHSATLFIFLNIAIAFGITATHVSINAQGFHIQERSKANVVVSSAGYWSAGALFTAILSGFLVGNIGLSAHISALSIFAAIVTLIIVAQFGSTLVPPNEHPETDYAIKDIFTTFHFDWRISIGLACAVYLEFAIGDWGTIFTKERLDVSAGLSTLPYIVFTIFMIIGRLSIQRFTARYQLHQLARVLSLVAGIGFVITISIATHLPPESIWTSYGLFLLAFALAGIGSSILGPTFTAAANRRSPNPSAVVIGQLGVANNVITTVLKWFVAGVIGATGSIALAMMIPGVLMILAAFFTPVIKEGSK
ncbi:MFS_MosC_like domain containing protein [Candidatus Nanopelagicaceae bacterium]